MMLSFHNYNMQRWPTEIFSTTKPCSVSRGIQNYFLRKLFCSAAMFNYNPNAIKIVLHNMNLFCTDWVRKLFETFFAVYLKTNMFMLYDNFRAVNKNLIKLDSHIFFLAQFRCWSRRSVFNKILNMKLKDDDCNTCQLAKAEML